jgi:hypothetical protein
MNPRLIPAILAIALTFAGISSSAQAKGCLTGAAVGGVAGHLAGHHTTTGAVAGCAAGHHEAAKHARKQQNIAPASDQKGSGGQATTPSQ